jgi:hypothetical protein
VFTGVTYKEPEEKAAGGRIGYQNAGPVMPSAMPSNMPAQESCLKHQRAWTKNQLNQV